MADKLAICFPEKQTTNKMHTINKENGTRQTKQHGNDLQMRTAKTQNTTQILNKTHTKGDTRQIFAMAHGKHVTHL
jgi:hypothetical protein